MPDHDLSNASPGNPRERDHHAQGTESGGPGSMLRQARERMGMTPGELAARTRLTTSTIEALESDDLTQLTAAVYAQGYYRACARALGVNEADVAAAYRRLAQKHPTHRGVRLPSPEDVDVPLPAKRRRIGGTWLTIPLIVVIVVLAGWYVQRHRLNEGGATPSAIATAGVGRHTARAPTNSVPPAAQPSTPPNAAHTPRPVQPTGSTPEEAPAAHASTAALSARSVDAATALEATAAPPLAAAVAGVPSLAGATTTAVASSGPNAAAQLVLDFSGRSWVQVTDATGKRLLTGIFSAGSQVVHGVPPYKVILGDAHFVQVRYAGQPIAIAAFIQANSTARFHLPLTTNATAASKPTGNPITAPTPTSPLNAGG